jgi:hypothetical protein
MHMTLELNLMKAPKPKQLYDVQEWTSEKVTTGNVEKRIERLVQTHERGVAYTLAALKCNKI